MKFIKDNIILILWVIVAVLAAFQIKSCVDPKPVNEKAVRNDEKVKALQRELEYKDSLYSITIAAKDSQFAALSDKLTINRTSVQQSNDRIKTLPSRTNSMPIDDVLRTIDQ